MESVEIFYPDENFSKLLNIESARGNNPCYISIVIPSITEPYKPFPVKIAIFDENYLPSFEFNETLIIEEETEKKRIPLKFKKGNPAIAFIKNFVKEKEGFFRIFTKFNKTIFNSNPSLSTKNPPFKIFWGDPHVHTVLSDCHAIHARSPYFSCLSGKYLTFLDWISITDHVSNGRGTTGKWKENIVISNFYNKSGEFIIIPGYEASLKGFSGGDNNVYLTKYPDIFVDEYENGNIKTLCKKLKEKSKRQNFDFFIVPHHTSRSKKHGEISEEIYPGKEFMPSIEIYSKWGSSEYPENPYSLVEPHNGKSYVIDYLKNGIFVGFIAGTDTHASIPGWNGKEKFSKVLVHPPGLTAVFAPSLQINSIFKGIKNRKTYATIKERVFLDFKINGISGGEIIKYEKKLKKREIRVITAGESDIEKIEILRNGDVIYSSNFNNWFADIKFIDDQLIKDCYIESKILNKFVFYYVRVKFKSNSYAWSSPIFIQI